MSDQQADVLVSVDLGTTFTGVAWMTPKTPIQVINDWPGSGDRGERKVPTVIVYNGDNSVSSWGFPSLDGGGDDTPPVAANDKTRREFFKIFLDANTLAAAHQQGLQSAPRSAADAQRYMADFLAQVYAHVKESVERQLGIRQSRLGWGSLAVTFLFSVPTTWTSMDIINTFKSVIWDAGYGREAPQHKALVDLTEAEAAAVATLKTSAVRFTSGSLFLAVDAGGGTTDLALMRITSTDQEAPQMSQMAAVRGVGVGSSLIDRAFARLVAQRLAAFPDVNGQLPNELPTRLARSHNFKTVKHKFGETVYMQQTFKMQLDGVAHDFSHEGLGIENGRMLFEYEEIQALFDAQVDGIMARIKEQLDWVTQHGHLEKVQHMMLSGGLGSSVYVRETLQLRLTALKLPSAPDIVVIPCQDPQLVVVRGLLLDQQQKFEAGNRAVLASRVARASYGVVIKQRFDPAVHFDEDIQQDKYDPAQKWAAKQIQWLIKKGDTITPNSPLAKPFEVRLGPDENTRSFDSSFVVSHNDVSSLPRSLKHAGASLLCQVQANLDGIQQSQLILKKKRGACCFGGGYHFYILSFEVHVVLAPADLRFELWFNNERFSGNHEPIAVTWDAVGAKSSASG